MSGVVESVSDIIDCGTRARLGNPSTGRTSPLVDGIVFDWQRGTASRKFAHGRQLYLV
jgi:hypothetical protein